MNKLSLPTPRFGTFRLKDEEAKHSVADALEAGFRHIDTAQMYENEEQVGSAIQSSGIARKDIFLTTKVWFDNLSADKFTDSVNTSLKKLQTDYVDLLLIHWPSPDEDVPMTDYLPELKNCKDKGLCKYIGVSNFTIAQIEQAIDILGEGQILTNQFEAHPYFQNKKLVKFCQSKGIEVTAYMPLAVGKVMEGELLKKIAKAHNTSAASVALAWLHIKDIVSIPSSTNKDHMQNNLMATQISLNEDEIALIDALGPQERIVDPDFAPKWDV